VGVGQGVGQDLLHNPAGLLSTALILFLDDIHCATRLDSLAVSSFILVWHDQKFPVFLREAMRSLINLSELLKL
jgi:hypothetical protein